MRLFVGLSFPDHVTSSISALRGSLPDTYWLDPETYHLTLHFIGNIDQYHMINDIDLQLQKIKMSSFSLTITSVNYFIDSNQEITLWAGIEPSPHLIKLHKKIISALKLLNIPINKKKFIPHITLGKSKNLTHEQLQNWLYHYNLLKIPTGGISQFSLFSSYPNKHKPHYIQESDYHLS